MKKTDNYGLALYEKEDKMIITAVENSLNANMEIIDNILKEKANNEDIPTKTSELTNDSSFATENYVKNEIANAQLGGGESGEIDLSGYATKDELHNHNNKDVLDNISSEDIEKWNAGGDVDLSDYATKEYVNDTIADIKIPDSSQNTNDAYLTGKKLVSFGDSITWQDGNTWGKYELVGRTAVGYQSYAVTELGLNHLNKGVSNTTLAKTTNTSAGTPLINSFENGCPAYLEGVDIVTIAHGTNDLSSNNPIGEIGSYTDTTFDLTTFYGAYRHIINTIISAHPEIRIILCTPIHKRTNEPSDYRANESGHYLRDYAEAVRNIARMYSLSVCDFYDNAGLNQYNADTFFPDGVHPNALGYSRMGGVYVDAIKSLGKVGFDTEKGIFSITKNLTNCTLSNPAATVIEGVSFSTEILANTGFVIDSISVVMGNTDITADVVSGSNIFIPKVSGSVVINAVAVESAEEIPITGISLNTFEATIYMPETITLKATLSPSGTTQRDLAWRSLDESIATVSVNGVVTGVSAGVTKIICESTINTDVKAECSVTVVSAPSEPIVYTNLFDKSDILVEKYFDGANGAIISDSNFNTSNYIDISSVPAGTKMVRNTGAGLMFFDSNKNFISSVPYNVAVGDIPSGAMYCASHFQKSMPIDQVVIGTLDYYGEVNIPTGVNLITDKILNGFYHGETGVFTENDTLGTTELITVFPLAKYSVENNINILGFDKNQEFLRCLANNQPLVPCDVRYVRVNYNETKADIVEFKLGS